jgi:hypothetical protein
MRWWLLGVALISLSAPSAWGCGNGKVLFSDSFDTFQSAWGKPSDYAKVVDGRLQLSEVADKSYSIYAGPTFDDMDLCAKVRLVGTGKPDAAYVGVMFWAKDVENFYTLQITPDGHATVYQQIDRKWTQIITDRQVAAIHQGSTRFNELEVVTRGHDAAFYINGEHLDDIAGREPDGGQHIGFTVEAPDTSDAVFVADDLTVSEPD